MSSIFSLQPTILMTAHSTTVSQPLPATQNPTYNLKMKKFFGTILELVSLQQLSYCLDSDIGSGVTYYSGSDSGSSFGPCGGPGQILGFGLDWIVSSTSSSLALACQKS